MKRTRGDDNDDDFKLDCKRQKNEEINYLLSIPHEILRIILTFLVGCELHLMTFVSHQIKLFVHEYFRKNIYPPNVFWSNIIQRAGRHNYNSILNWAKNFGLSSLSSIEHRIFYGALKGGHVSNMDYLETNFNYKNTKPNLLWINAISSGNSATINWLEQKNPIKTLKKENGFLASFETKAVSGCLSSGNLNSAIWLKNQGFTLKPSSWISAIESCSLDMLNWLLTEQVNKITGSEFSFHLTKTKSVELLEWSLKHEMIKFTKEDKYIVRHIVIHGNLPFLKYLHESKYNILDDVGKFLTIAAKRGHFNILLWAYNQKIFPVQKPESKTWSTDVAQKYNKDYLRDCSICKMAAGHGNLEIVKWLKGIGCSWKQSALHHALLSDQFHIFKWICNVDKTIKLDLDSILIKIIKLDRPDILDFIQGEYQGAENLFSITKDFTNGKIYQQALAHGSFNIFNWALKLAFPGYIKTLWNLKEMHEVIIHSIKIGSKENLKLYIHHGYFLKHEKSPLYCREAAISNNLEILIFLFDHGAKLDTKTCEAACGNGNLKMLTWLVEKGCEITIEHVQIACKKGYLNIVEYINETKYAKHLQNVEIYNVSYKHDNIIKWAVCNKIKMCQKEWSRFGVKVCNIVMQDKNDDKFINFLELTKSIRPEINQKIIKALITD